MSRVKIGRKIARRIRWQLDRPGWRWILAGSFSLLSSFTGRYRCRVQWTGAAWSYRYQGSVLLSDQLLVPAHTFDPDLEIAVWGYQPSSGDTILELGSGTGTETVRLAKSVGPTGKVIAVEAHPRMAAIMVDALKLNGLNNVVPVSAAVANMNQLVGLSDDSESGLNSLFVSSDIFVVSTRLLDILSDLEIDQVDLLKVNIEGAELSALEGLGDQFERLGNVVISCHDFLNSEWGQTRERVKSWLIAHGFNVTARLDDPRPWCRDYIYASRGSEKC